ncbi:MAG TPA: hypothetical protein VLV15_08455 [Dongiaceae bacterium]|nr:hypothetical protein [Dongiaceae bacterium]
MHEHDDELTPAEREAFRALPRELDPGRLLEERTVNAVRERGLFAGGQPRRVRFGLPFHPAWVAAGAAACVALFLGGFTAGQELANRRASQMVLEMRKQDAAQAAAMVQQTGSAYVAALSALADAARDPHARGTELASAREVATNSLHAAASELVRLAPEEPLAAQILRGLEQAGRRDSLAGGVTEQRKVAWF